MNGPGSVGSWTLGVDSTGAFQVSNTDSANRTFTALIVDETSGNVRVKSSSKVGTAVDDTSGALNVHGDLVLSHARPCLVMKAAAGASPGVSSPGARIVLYPGTDDTDTAVGVDPAGPWIGATTGQIVQMFSGTTRCAVVGPSGTGVVSKQDASRIVYWQPNREDTLVEQVHESTTDAPSNEPVPGMVFATSRVFKAFVVVVVTGSAGTCAYYELTGVKRVSGTWDLCVDCVAGDSPGIVFAVLDGQVVYSKTPTPGFVRTVMTWKAKSLFDV